MSERLTIPEVLPKFVEYLRNPKNVGGGTLHIWLWDGNDKDAAIQWCRRWAEKNDDAAGVELADIGLRLSRTQRRRIVVLAEEAAGF